MRVLVTGATGMLGQAVLRAALVRTEFTILAPHRVDLDLTDKRATDRYIARNGIDAILHLAAHVGGIHANIANPADFYLQNVLINTHLIDSAHRNNVQRLINIGSSCMYPKDLGRRLREADLLAAPLEPTNEGYALSKICAAKHCEYLAVQHGRFYRTLIPCNLYGPNDDFSPDRSHLVAAVIAKIAEAKARGSETVTIWGDGTARREFLFVDDLADYLVSQIGEEETLPPYMNVGAGEDLTVNEYHSRAAEIIGYEGGFVHDALRPVGMKRKLLDSSLAAAHGWRPTTTIAGGLAITYAHYMERYHS